MWLDIVNTSVGIVLGLLTGYYFERRASNATREQNKELERELADLRTSVYSVGGGQRPPAVAPGQATDLTKLVLDRARSTQDASGRVSKTALTAHFFARGNRATEVDSVLLELADSGRVRDLGKWLEIQ